MKWKRKKTYGNYKTSTCPFCERLATSKNEQGLEVCHKHKTKLLDEIKCVCGSWLESCSGKFGPYFNCLNCGNVNYNKAMEMKEMRDSGNSPDSKLKVKSQKNVNEDETTDNQINVTKIKKVVRDDFSTMMKKERLRKFNEEKEKTITTNDFEYFN